MRNAEVGDDGEHRQSGHRTILPTTYLLIAIQKLLFLDLHFVIQVLGQHVIMQVWVSFEFGVVSK